MLQIMWPPIAPIGIQYEIHKDKRWWMALCILNIIPIAAIFHHLIFYRFSCMLNAFGYDYSLAVVYKWLSQDPSLFWSILVMIFVYHIGKFIYLIRILIAPIFLSFFPLSVWIWDIPFTGRFICYHFHDGRMIVAKGAFLASRHFYIFGLILYLLFVAYLFQKQKRFTGKYRSI